MGRIYRFTYGYNILDRDINALRQPLFADNLYAVRIYDQREEMNENIDIKNKTLDQGKHQNVWDSKLDNHISKQYFYSYNQTGFSAELKLTLVLVERNNWTYLFELESV